MASDGWKESRTVAMVTRDVVMDEDSTVLSDGLSQPRINVVSSVCRVASLVRLALRAHAHPHARLRWAFARVYES